jgi:hypothetical protein
VLSQACIEHDLSIKQASTVLLLKLHISVCLTCEYALSLRCLCYYVRRALRLLSSIPHLLTHCSFARNILQLHMLSVNRDDSWNRKKRKRLLCSLITSNHTDCTHGQEHHTHVSPLLMSYITMIDTLSRSICEVSRRTWSPKQSSKPL